MSGKSPTKDLLSKLREGQEVLWRTIENLKPSEERMAEVQTLLTKRKMDRLSRDSLTIAIDRVDKLPKKRARLRQLSPEYEVLRDSRSNKRPRRASSTPARETRVTLPSTKISHRLVSNGSQPLNKKLYREDEKENGLANYSLPSPKLSRIVVDTSRTSRMTPVKGSPKPSSSSLKVPGEKGRKSHRGLTVSFVEEENTRKTRRSRDPGLSSDGGQRRLVRHTAQRDAGVSDGFTLTDFGREADSSPERPHFLPKKMTSTLQGVRSSPGPGVHGNAGDRLIDSLNSSKYGAMERRYAESRMEGRFPRGSTGLREDPKLGYDWIAGLLDTSGPSMSDRDDEYFCEMKEFRRVNYAECHQTKEFVLPASVEELKSGHSQEEDEGCDGVEDFNGKRTCVSSYMLNDRLFPMHMSTQPHSPGTSCPTCEDPPTRTHPPRRCVRVSVPHSLVQPVAQPEPHRRRSFDPSDSMGLSKHCMAGWENAQPSMVPPQPAVGLRGSLKQPGPAASHSHKANSSSSKGQNLLDTSHSIEYNIRSRSNPRS